MQGYIKCINRDDYTIEHLERLVKTSNIYWKYSLADDIQIVKPNQILDCQVCGDWDLSIGSPKFKISNLPYILSAFNQFLA